MVPARKILYVTLTAVLALAMAAPGVSLAADPPADVDSQSVVFWKDVYESDDTTDTAATVPEVSTHTFHEIDDVDFVKIVAEEGQRFAISTEFIAANNGENDEDNGEFDTRMWVYAEDGVTMVAEEDDNDLFPSYSSSFVWEAPYSGTFFLEIGEYGSNDRGVYRLYLNSGMGHRIFGVDRYDTSAAVSHRLFDNANIFGEYDNGYEMYVPNVVVASGESYADAITGSVLAAAYDAPLFLTTRDSVPSSVAEEIRRLFSGPDMYFYYDRTTVNVVGGTSAVGNGALQDLGMIETVSNLEVIEGADRYETAVEVANTVYEENGVYSAYIVNGEAWADAIAVGSVAPYNDGVILLTEKDSVPQVTLDAIDDLGIEEVIVVGGEAVVSEDVVADLEAVAGEGNVSRIAGADRYQTARRVAEHGLDDLYMNASATLLASGEAYPDALTAASLAWWMDTPVLLTPKDSLSGEVVTFLEEYGPIPYLETDEDESSRVGDVSYLVGGPNAIADSVYHTWRELFFEPVYDD